MGDKNGIPRILAYRNGEAWTEDDEAARCRVFDSESRKQMRDLNRALDRAREMGWVAQEAVLSVLLDGQHRDHRTGDIYGASPAIRYAGSTPRRLN